MTLPSDFRARPLIQLNKLWDEKVAIKIGLRTEQLEEELSDYPGFIQDLPKFEADLHEEFEALINAKCLHPTEFIKMTIKTCYD